MKKATIIDIAHHAKVSVGSVSNFINGKKQRKTTEEKIAKSMGHFNYQPSIYAKYLKNAQAGQVLILVVVQDEYVHTDKHPQASTWCFDFAILRNLMLYLKSLSMDAHVEFISQTEIASKEYLERLILSHHGQIVTIISPFTLNINAMLTIQKEKPVNFISLFNYYHAEISSISVDNRWIAQEAVSWLQQNRGANIAYIGGLRTHLAAQDREKSYRSQVQTPIVFGDSWDYESGFQAAQHIWENHRNINGIFCASDHLAYGACGYFRQVGVKIPQDFSIIGVDNIDLFDTPFGRVSTFDIPYHRLGIEGAKMMADFRQQLPKEPVHIKINTELLHFDTSR